MKETKLHAMSDLSEKSKNASADIPDKTDGENLSGRLNMEMSALLVLFTNLFSHVMTQHQGIWNNVNKIILTLKYSYETHFE